MLTPALTTKDKLLRAALEIVARDGFEAATTAAIASAAGVERGVFKSLPGDLMSNLFFAPVGYMLKSELRGRRWSEAELDATAEAVLDSWRA